MSYNVQSSSDAAEGPRSGEALWSFYLQAAEKEDKAMTERWRGQMEGILIFAGLFSASVTSFLIESYKRLQPDPGDQTVALLTQISGQLAGIPAAVNDRPDSSADNPDISSVACNACWLLSLALSLSCAVLATLVQDWIRHYVHAKETPSSIELRGDMRSKLYSGLQQYHFDKLVTTIPFLLHLALFLFFVGLSEFLRPINWLLSRLVVAMIVVSTVAYMVLTLACLRGDSCPFRTPLSSATAIVFARIRWSPLGSSIIGFVRSFIVALMTPYKLLTRARYLKRRKPSPQSTVCNQYNRDAQRQLEAMTWAMEHSWHWTARDETLKELAADIPAFLRQTGLGDQTRFMLIAHHQLSFRTSSSQADTIRLYCICVWTMLLSSDARDGKHSDSLGFPGILAFKMRSLITSMTAIPDLEPIVRPVVCSNAYLVLWIATNQMSYIGDDTLQTTFEYVCQQDVAIGHALERAGRLDPYGLLIAYIEMSFKHPEAVYKPTETFTYFSRSLPGYRPSDEWQARLAALLRRYLVDMLSPQTLRFTTVLTFDAVKPIIDIAWGISKCIIWDQWKLSPSILQNILVTLRAFCHTLGALDDHRGSDIPWLEKEFAKWVSEVCLTADADTATRKSGDQSPLTVEVGDEPAIGFPIPLTPSS